MCGEEIPLGCVKGHLKSGHLSEKRLFCGATFVALSVLSFPTARAPPVLSHATLHSLQLDQIFGFYLVLLEICIHQTKNLHETSRQILEVI